MITSGQPPKLLSDARRSWISAGIAVVASFAAIFGHVFFTIRSGGRFSTLLSQTLAVLVIFIVQFVGYQILTWRAFASLDAATLRRWTHKTTPHTHRARLIQAVTGVGATTFAVSAALTSLAAVVAVVIFVPLQKSVLIVSLSVLTVAAGWVMIVFSYAVGYLRADVEERALGFPGDAEPVWRDYFYLAAQVSTTFSTSDVEVRTTKMRGRVTTQSIIAFAFNTLIVALLVSALLAFKG